MIYTFIVDSYKYLAPYDIGHYLPQVYHKFFAQFGEIGFNLAAIIQIIFILYSAHRFNKSLKFNNKLLSALSLIILASPTLYWGRQIGSDALGYSFMLIAFSLIQGDKKAFIAVSVLATLCRFQYVFLFGMFFLHKETRIAAIIICCITLGVLMNHPSFNGKLVRVHNYLECSIENKPPHIPHALYYNMAIGGDNKHLQIIPDTCDRPKIDILPHLADIADIISSKIRYGFRFHQIAAILLLCLLPIKTISTITSLNIMHYSVVILTASLFYHQYTFMIEATLIATIIRVYEEYKNLTIK